MNRTIIVAVVAAYGMLLQDAVGQERHSMMQHPVVRRVLLDAFPAALVGSWAETADQCGAKDKSTIAIESAKYSDVSGTCAVLRIVGTPGSQGPSYSVRAQCSSAKGQTKTQTVNIIVCLKVTTA